ncbi:MAG: hypothetical protein ABSG59_09260 [Verrucomicrobiota bacterium]|jgi:rod shape-determining protein MreD
MNWLESIFILAVAFVAVFLEAWLNLPGRWLGAQIDVLPALMVYASLRTGVVTMALLAVCGGLWFDSLSLNPLGVSVLPLMVIGLVIYRNRDLLLREQAHAQAILGVVASALQPMGTLFILLNTGAAPLLDWGTLWQLMVMAAGGGLATPVCFALFGRIHHAFEYPLSRQSSFRPDREIKRGRA